MAIDIKTLQQTEQLLSNAIIKAVNTGQTDSSKKIDPTLDHSFILGLVRAFSLGTFENNKNIQKAILDAFLGGSSWLEFTASLINVNRQDASGATGNIVLTGTAGTLISQGSLITRSSGIQYSTNADTTITNQTINIASIIRLGNQVIVTTVDNHNLADSVLISINGADQTDYNVINQEISVTGLKTFAFDISTTPVTPATGTLTLDFTSAIASVTSTTLGANTNVGSVVELTLVNAITNVDSAAFPTFDGISGGLDVESDESLNERVREKYQSYFAQSFSKVGIPIFLKEAVAGITRVWVKDAFPTAGQVTIYFVRDNDENILPDTTQIATVKDAIINGTDTIDPIKPSNTPDDYIIVLAPDPVTVNLNFASVTPNTDDMKTAIENNLIDYFKNNAEFETSISKNDLYNVIYSTTDSQGNTPSVSIALIDIIVGTGQIPILGTVSF